MTSDTVSRTRPYIGWRLLALFYDLWPMVALWMLLAVPFVLVDAAMAGPGSPPAGGPWAASTR